MVPGRMDWDFECYWFTFFMGLDGGEMVDS